MGAAWRSGCNAPTASRFQPAHGAKDLVPWLCSQTDLLANDWGVVDD